MLPRLTDETFFDAIQSDVPIFVTFTAPKRCQACRDQKPSLTDLAGLGVPVYLVDVEEPDTFGIEARLGGRGVPYHKVYQRGSLIREYLGNPMSTQALLDFYAYAPPKPVVAPVARHDAVRRFGRG